MFSRCWKGLRPVTTLLAGHFRLSSSQCPNSQEEEDEIFRVSYASVVGSLMYAIVCTRSDLAYAISTVSRFMLNPRNQHWEAVNRCYDIYEGLRLDAMLQRFKMEKPRVLQ